MNVQNWIRRAGGLPLTLLLSACASTYSAKSINATVVDVDTGAPLEGVVVVAHWALEFGLEGGMSKDLQLMETVTDSAGHFSFSAWGPEPVPSGLPWEARLKARDPELILVKLGYKWMATANDRPLSGEAGHGPSVRTSDWDGKTIRMKKYAGTDPVYGGISGSALTGVSYGGCNFKKIPRMLATLIDAETELQRQHLDMRIFTVDYIQALTQGKCGSVKDFLSGYLHK